MLGFGFIVELGRSSHLMKISPNNSWQDMVMNCIWGEREASRVKNDSKDFGLTWR